MQDEVYKLIVLKSIGLEQHVPEHLKEEFDRHWTEREANKKRQKLLNDPLSVQRWEAMYSGFVEKEDGDWVSYEDFVKVVEHLKKEADEAYQRGCGSGGDTYSWRL